MSSTAFFHRSSRRRLLALAALAIGLSLVAEVGSAKPASAAVIDGKTAATAAASCWEIKTTKPSSPSGVYWLVTPKLRTADRFYCDMTTDGGGWVLIGRGREGWTGGRNGLDSTASVIASVTGPAAFDPRQLTGETVDGLLNGTRVDALAEGVRVRRATNAAGSNFQEVRFAYANRAAWSWPFNGPAEKLSTYRVALAGNPTRVSATGTSRDVTAGADDGWRTFTFHHATNSFKAGWAYGAFVTWGNTSPSSYLWSATGTHGVPFAQVFIRPKLFTGKFSDPATKSPSVAVDSVTNLQVLQRGSNGRADIPVSGTYGGKATAVQARWKGGAWTTIDAAPRGGFFRGTLASQPTGQGSLEVRLVGVTATSTIPKVSVGDIFVVAGQSNAVGQGTNPQSYSHPTIGASIFDGNDAWRPLADPTGRTGQLDPALNNGVDAKGSAYPLIASAITGKTGVPVAIVPSARNSSKVAQWLPGTPLHDALLRRIGAVGGRIAGMLWFQGESNVWSDPAVYEAQLAQLVNSVATATGGARTVVGQIGEREADDALLDGIRLAQKAVIDREAAAVPGPAMYDVNLHDEGGDYLHYKSDADIRELARRWSLAIDAAFYGGAHGFGPVLDPARSFVDRASGEVVLAFGGDAGAQVDGARSTATPSSFSVTSGGASVAITKVIVANGEVRLTLDPAVDVSAPVHVSYGSGRTAVDHAVYDASGLPAMPVIGADIAVR